MKEKKVIKSIAMISQIGISMLVPIFLCCGVGYWINEQFHQELWFLLLMLIGVGAAFRNLFLLTKSFYGKEEKEEEKRRKELEKLKQYHRNHPGEDFSHVMEGKSKRYPDPKGPPRS